MNLSSFFLYLLPHPTPPSPPTLPPAGRPNSACGPEVSARHRHVSVHHGAHGRRCAHPTLPLQLSSRWHHRDHRDLPEPALHREQRSTHVPGPHLLEQVEPMVEEGKVRRGKRDEIASRDVSPAFVYWSGPSLSPQRWPLLLHFLLCFPFLDIPALSALC